MISTEAISTKLNEHRGSMLDFYRKLNRQVFDAVGEVQKAIKKRREFNAEQEAMLIAGPWKYKGPYNNERVYDKNDAVTRGGGTWICMVSGTVGMPPGTRNKRWHLLVKDGVGAPSRDVATEAFLWRALDDAEEAVFDMNFPVGELTLGGNRTIVFEGARPGGTYVLILKQDDVGSRTVTWPANVRWPDNAAPVLTTEPGAADHFNFLYDGTVFYGTVSQRFILS